MSKNEEKSKNNYSLFNSSKKTKGIKLDPAKSQRMANYRIIQKNLVYVIGLSEKLTSKELLGKYEYFGQYGHISKIIVNKNKAYYGENQTSPSYSVYISYSSASEAALAILAIDSVVADDHLIRASFGTTKYCTFYLKNADCPNKDCLYIHSQAEDEVVVNKEELTSNNSTKNIFYEQHLLAIKLANVFDKDVKKNMLSNSKKKTVFPSLESVYSKDIVVKNDPEFLKKSKTHLKPKMNFVSKIEDKKTLQSLSNNITPKNYSQKINYNPEAKIELSGSDKSCSDKCNSDKCNSDSSEAIMQTLQILQNKENINGNIDNNNTGNLSISEHKSLYRNRDKSRFTFVPSGEEIQISSGIPEYVFDVINKKASRYSFFKKFENEFDLENIKNEKIYFEESFLKCGHYRNDSWKDFIFNNLNMQNQLK